MTTTRQATLNDAATPGRDQGTRTLAFKAGRFFLHLLEMLLAMSVGMALFHVLLSVIPASSRLDAAFRSGTTLHSVAMVIFMTAPMVGWMVIRGHGWAHGMEMAVAMVAPTAAVGLLCQLGLDAYLPWLAEASGPAMLLGMIAAMLYRLNHYTGAVGGSAHTAGKHNEQAWH